MVVLTAIPLPFENREEHAEIGIKKEIRNGSIALADLVFVFVVVNL